MNNPQTHYLQHQQNTSISKQSTPFAKAPRFLQPKNTPTDFNYSVNLYIKKRSCNFGYGRRSQLIRVSAAPSPNKYNISKFPYNNRSASMGCSRDQATFGTIGIEINAKAKLPPPGAYTVTDSIKSSKFTLKQRLPTEIDINLRRRYPGPGQYQSTGINSRGRYPTSKFKNVRVILMDCVKKQLQKRELQTGPGSYDLFNSDSEYSRQKIEMMRNTTTKLFGTQKRKGPEEQHKLFVPGPGMYQTFSSFGDNMDRICARVHTHY